MYDVVIRNCALKRDYFFLTSYHNEWLFRCNISSRRWRHALKALTAGWYVHNLYGTIANKSFIISWEGVITLEQMRVSFEIQLMLHSQGNWKGGITGLKVIHTTPNLQLFCCIATYLEGPKLYSSARGSVFICTVDSCLEHIIRLVSKGVDYTEYNTLEEFEKFQFTLWNVCYIKTDPSQVEHRAKLQSWHTIHTSQAKRNECE